MTPPPPRSTLFPYTTLFRSHSASSSMSWSVVPGCAAMKYGIRYCSLRSEEHTSELQSLAYLVCRLLLEKKKVRKRHRSVVAAGRPARVHTARSVRTRLHAAE